MTTIPDLKQARGCGEFNLVKWVLNPPQGCQRKKSKKTKLEKIKLKVTNSDQRVPKLQ